MGYSVVLIGTVPCLVSCVIGFPEQSIYLIKAFITPPFPRRKGCSCDEPKELTTAYKAMLRDVEGIFSPTSLPRFRIFGCFQENVTLTFRLAYSVFRL